jgi:hypothetical protein
MRLCINVRQSPRFSTNSNTTQASMSTKSAQLEAQTTPRQIDQSRPPLLGSKLATQPTAAPGRCSTADVSLAVSLPADIIVFLHGICASALVASQVTGMESLRVWPLREDTRALNGAAARNRSAQRPTERQSPSFTWSSPYSRLLGVVVLAPGPTSVNIEVLALKGLVALGTGETRGMPLALQLPVVGRDHSRLNQLVAPPTCREIHLLPVRFAEYNAIAFNEFAGSTHLLAAFLTRLDPTNWCCATTAVRRDACVLGTDRRS